MTASAADSIEVRRGAEKSSPTLSALVVARNEEQRLAACLERLAFADEIVVVLDRSTDRSAEIAHSFKARVLEGGWEREGERRNAGIDACRGDWILEVDADEWVPPELGAEIRHAIASAAGGYFLIPFANHVGDHLVRHGWGAYNGVPAKWSLFTKGLKHWGDQRVHPATRLEGVRGKLKAPILHYVDGDLTQTFARLNRYSELAAADLAEAGRCPSGLATGRRMITRFWKSYISRQGWREGFYGIALGTFSALYPLFLYLKIKEKRSRPGGGPT